MHFADVRDRRTPPWRRALARRVSDRNACSARLQREPDQRCHCVSRRLLHERFGVNLPQDLRSRLHNGGRCARARHGLASPPRVGARAPENRSAHATAWRLTGRTFFFEHAYNRDARNGSGLGLSPSRGALRQQRTHSAMHARVGAVGGNAPGERAKCGNSGAFSPTMRGIEFGVRLATTKARAVDASSRTRVRSP